MIQPRTFSALLALGALTALPGCSYAGPSAGVGGHKYSQATPATQSSNPAAPQETAEANNGPQSQARQPVTTALVRKVQSKLKRDGLYHGNLDGIWGPRSQHAAMQFQQKHNLKTTGKIDQPTLQAMNLNLSNTNQQYGQANTGANGNMAPNANRGPNGNMGHNQYGQANTGPNATGGNGPGGPNHATPNQRYGQANSGANGTMAPNVKAGPHANNNQYGEANTGPNAMQNGPNRNYTIGNQNTGGAAQASNVPYNGPNTPHQAAAPAPANNGQANGPAAGAPGANTGTQH